MVLFSWNDLSVPYSLFLFSFLEMLAAKNKDIIQQDVKQLSSLDNVTQKVSFITMCTLRNKTRICQEHILIRKHSSRMPTVPCFIINKFDHVRGDFCMVRSNASCFVITWELHPPRFPLNRMMDTKLKTLP